MRTRLLARLPGSTTFRWLIAAAILFPLAVLAIAGFLSRQEALRAAERNVAQKIDILHEHAAKLFETQQLVLWQVDALIRGMSWEEIAASQALHGELVRTADALDQADAIWLSDADGTVRAGSHSFPLAPFSIVDRDYWQALRESGVGPYISRAYPGRVTSRFRFNVAVRRTSPGGEGFDGVLVVSVAPKYLEDFYSRVSDEAGFIVGLVRDDGHMIVRYPSLGGAPPVLTQQNPVVAAVASGADRGLYWARSELEGVLKLYGWRRVSGFPVSVIFALPESTVLAPWREAMVRNAWVAAASVAVLIAVILGVYKLRRLELEVLADRFQTVQQLSLDSFALLTAVRGRDGRIVDFVWDYANPVALRIFGAEETGLKGRRLLEQLPATAAGPGGLLERYAQVVETGEPHDIEVSFSGDGIPGWFRNSAIRFGDGVAIQCSDVTERRQVQEGLRAALAERDRLLEQKELLIKEVNHRVKNSLQLVSGMLSLDALSAADPAVRRRMEEAVGRVRAIAAVHERLYRSDDVQKVEVGVFLRELCGHLARQLGLPAQNLVVDADDTTVLTDRAPPLALLTNELVTNALKHGRAERGEMRVEITFRRSEAHFRLEVRDYGPGLPPGFDPSQTKGLGMRIAQGLAAQVGGRVAFEAANPGTRAIIIGVVEELTASQAA